MVKDMPLTERAQRAVGGMGLLLALALASQACDKFFDIRGVLSDCTTAERIAGAQGVAVTSSNADRKQFATDAAGVFAVHMNAPEEADVAVTFAKPEYVDLTVMYHGVPADADHVELCMTRSP